VRLEARTKPHVYQKFEFFWTNIASTMACPNFKNGQKNGLGPLGIKLTPKIPCGFWTNLGTFGHIVGEIIFPQKLNVRNEVSNSRILK
jgi:hypothetical protein